MSPPPSATALASPVAPARTLTSRGFVSLLVAQSAFGFGWSTFFLLPKLFKLELGMNAEEIGRAAAAVGVTCAIVVAGVGILLDRHGRLPFMRLGAALTSFVAVGYLFVDRHGPFLYLLQVLQGLGFVLAFTASLTLAADLAPIGQTSRALGLFGATNLTMNALAPAVGERVAGAFGWETVFAVSAVSSLLSVFLTLSIVEPARRAAPEKRSRTPLRIRPLAPLLVTSTAIAVAFGTLFTLQPPYAIERGVQDVAPFFIGFTIAALVTRLGLGGVADRIGSRPVLVISSIAYVASPVALAWLGPSHIALVGALQGLAHGVFYPAMTMHAVERSTDDTRGLALALTSGTFHLGSMFAGLVLGAVAARIGYEVAFLAAAGTAAFGALVIAFGERTKGATA